MSNSIQESDFSSSPEKIDGAEIILRGLYHKFHINKGKILPNAFAPRASETGVSVMRLKLTTISFCKYHLKQFQSSERQYVGFAKLYASNIYEAAEGDATATIEHKPAQYETHKLDAHSEIYYFLNGEIVPRIRNQELPAEVRIIIKKFCEIATPPLIDNNPNQEEWVGQEII